MGQPQVRSPDQTYKCVLQEIFRASANLPSLSFRLRFQLLSAIQCWWYAFGGPAAEAETLQEVWFAVKAFSGNSMPNATECAAGQDWISTKSHQEVIEALPEAQRGNALNEEFVFPFWL